MYSRAPRKFNVTRGATTNLPHLGPGCYYYHDPAYDLFMRKGDNISHAPFSSLAERVSAFDEMITRNPAPGLYDVAGAVSQTRRKPVNVVFAKSNVNRFGNVVNDNPGPAAYNVIKSRQPVQATEAEQARKEFFDNLPENGIAVENHPKESQKESADQPQKAEPKERRSSVFFKRKYLPPSIPTGHQTRGYDETETGELRLRPEPKKKEEEDLHYRYKQSFVDDIIQTNRGKLFAYNTGKRTEFRGKEGPGPASYDVLHSESALNKTQKPATISEAQMKRYMDQIAIDAEKQHVPGPGAYAIYDTKSPSVLKRLHQQPAFGTSTGRFDLSWNENPGPGSYSDLQSIKTLDQKSFRVKKQPFGGTAQRFDYYHKDIESKIVPGPGAYEIAETDFGKTLTSRTRLTKIQRDSLINRRLGIVFGSVTERFTEKQKQLAQENTNVKMRPSTAENRRTAGTADRRRRRRRKNRKSAIFQSHTNRFQREPDENPPVGAYDVSSAFDHLKTHGKLLQKTLAPYNDLAETRKIFNHMSDNPGPGQYDPKTPTKQLRGKGVTDFLSTQPRFLEKHEELPGPGTYAKHGDMLKKTYNVTFNHNILQK